MFPQFLKEEDVAQVIEYALIIAVVSIGLVLALQSSTLAASFGNFIGRVATCLTTGPCV
ncbi:pilus assembly protein Flp/PilA [Polaromonas sp. OV174]|uniref:Flp family type IVb pilin n=1 Tax=Polaromonas sp. OV174 TaxID=1855300 RepID=UPI0008E3BE4F|nr:Flp family type IVb pilin [Polaromonas sp. OV174]SFC26550.1 pilus assembly protein Flp/PilA [Polaromonas sp. OV174]